MDLTMARTSQRPMLALITLMLLIAAFVAATVLIGSQRRSPAPLFRNGAVVFAQDGDLFIADQPGGTSRPLVAGPDEDHVPVFSPQGDRIAFVREVPDDTWAARIMTVHPDGSAVTELAKIGDNWGLKLAWAPDGSALLVGSAVFHGSWQLDLVKSDGTGSRTIVAGRDVGAGPASWRPGGRHIAFLAEAGDAVLVYLADTEGMNARRLVIDDVVSPRYLAWSPDGTHLLVGDGLRMTIAEITEDGTVTGSNLVSLDPQVSVESDPVWAPDGGRLAFVARYGSTYRFAVVDPDGSDYRTVGPSGSSSFADTYGVLWSPDGRSLIVMGSVSKQDPETGTWRHVDQALSVDLATDTTTEVRNPVDSWQRLAP